MTTPFIHRLIKSLEKLRRITYMKMDRLVIHHMFI